MDVTDAFQVIFDKCPVSESKDTWRVDESDPGASFRELHIQNAETCFHVFGKDVYKGLSAMTSDRSSTLEDRDCDGAAWTERAGKDCLLLAELKSSLDSNDVLKAYRQISYTLLKLCMLLSVCEGFDDASWEAFGLIACLPPKDKDQEAKLKLDYLNLNEGHVVPPDVRCLVRLLFERKITCHVGDIPFVRHLPLRAGLRNVDFTLYMKTAASATDAAASVDFRTL